MKLTLHQIQACDQIVAKLPLLRNKAQQLTASADQAMRNSAATGGDMEFDTKYKQGLAEVARRVRPLAETGEQCLAEAERCAKTSRGLFALAARTLHEKIAAIGVGEPVADHQIVVGFLVDSATGQLRAAVEKLAEAVTNLEAAQSAEEGR